MNVEKCRSNDRGLKFSAPFRGFCYGSGRTIYGRDREIQKATGFWTSSLEILKIQEARMLQTFWSNDQGLNLAHPSRDFAMNLAGRSMGGTDRSRKRQAFGPRALKCCKISTLETRNPANFYPDDFRVPPARENNTKFAESLGFGDPA